MQITLGPQYNVGEVLGLDSVRNLLVYSTTQYYNTIVIKCFHSPSGLVGNLHTC